MTGLRKEEFQILDNRKEQPIRYFLTEDMPISLTVVLDASGSMEAKLPKAIQAAMRLFALASPNDDCWLMLARDTTGNYIVPKDLADVHSVLDPLKSKGYTALRDSIYLAANDLQKRAQYSRKAMVVISDGGDNCSRYPEEELRRLLVETDVQVYAVDLHNPFSCLSEERSGLASLEGFAKVPGGHMYTAMDRAALLSSIENINLKLRNQYVLGYMPDTLDHNGKWRKVKITVRRAAGMPKLHVTARRSYYVPVD